MWLVKVKNGGNTPIRFPNRMKKNSVNTNGKNFLPSWPICSTHKVITDFVSHFGGRLQPSRDHRAGMLIPTHISSSVSALATAIHHVGLADVKRFAPIGRTPAPV